MEGNRRIVLLEPQPTGESSDLAAVVEGPPKSHPVWAVREDKPTPGEGLVADVVEGGAWQVRYTIREESLGLAPRPREDWGVVDEDGETLQLTGVFEVNSGSRRRKLVLLCERTGT